MIHFTAVIPARIASTRFPAKALALLCGKPLIQCVWEAVVNTELFTDVLIATDSRQIYDCAIGFGAKCVMTSAEHQSGSDRIAEAINGFQTDVVLNVQGDEPLIDRTSLSKLMDVFADPDIHIASLMTKIKDHIQILDPNIVKVITNNLGNAIYFSRSPIPYDRDGSNTAHYFRHIGVYAYRKGALLEFVQLPPSHLESIEKLEQLRLIENNIPIRMVESDYQGIGIDTPEDLIMVENLLQEAK